MQKKVWVINDMEQVPPRRRVEHPAPKPLAAGKSKPLAAGNLEKNPALSFSLSMLLWGGGHLYIREFGLGSLFMGCMLLFYSVLTSLVLLRESVIRFVFESSLPVPVFFIGFAAFLVLGLACWLSSAVHAYHKTARGGSESFRGAVNEWWPALCSLLFPGWGQFLNAQPRKGVFFLAFGAVGICSVSFSLLALALWPALTSSSERYGLEICLFAFLLVAPACLLMWMISVHDSFWSCREPVRKRPLERRIQFARERIRIHGRGRYFRPKIKRMAIFTAFLAVAALAGIYLSPKGYYLEGLENVRIEMQSKEMKLIPEVVETAVAFLR